MDEAEFKCTLSATDLKFRRLQSWEAQGRLPEHMLELLRLSTKTPLKPDQLLGTEASVHIKLDNSNTRYIHGVITHFERGGVVGRYDVYRITLQPWLWQLELGADCRIFQDKTVVEILDAVFAEYKSASRVDKHLQQSFAKRPYTVQYRESDYNFVTRLMEEEGINFYFKYEASQHTLVLSDNPSGYQPVKVGKLEWATVGKGSNTREDVITQWSRAHTLQSLKYTHTDFAAETPATDLKADASRSAPYPAPNDLEVFDYPGGHDNQAMSGAGGQVAVGKTLAQHEVNRFESKHSVATGVTPYRGLAVGTTFTFEKHGDAGGYLVASTITDFEFAGYESSDEPSSRTYTCRFNAVPKTVDFLGERWARTPTVNGPQTATVMGPSGDEIHTDKYGRVKLLFHWDRVGKKDNLLEKSSCWVRVSHPWAGKGFGMIALPRVGDEVVVEFLEGNPDRPLITGRVYNGTNTPAYTLPDHATVSGIRTHSSKEGGADNFNELRFDDKKGSEYVWMQAEKDYHRLVKNDAHDTVKNDRWSEVIKNSQTKVGENYTFSVGKVSTISLTGDTHAKLGADLNSSLGGAFNLKVGGATAIKGDTSVALTSGASMDLNAGAGMNLTAASFMNSKAIKIVLEADMELCIKAGASFITLNASGVTIQGPIVKINSGGAAGSAKEAAKASPAAPKEPGEQKKNEDPLAGGSKS